MAFFPAHCDDNCTGCQMNNRGWCGFLHIPVEGYYDFENNTTAVYTNEDKYLNKEE